MRNKYISLPIIIFIILTLLNTLRIEDELKNYNESRYHSYVSELQTIKTNIKNVSDTVFDNIINTPEIISIFKNAHLSDKTTQALIRTKLYNTLKDRYKMFTNYGIQQLHFHLPNNDSFLRFHKPQKYGDDLTKIRESVRYVNQYKKPAIGFEEGKIFNGYRFVYPLFDEKNQHLGSVEVSASLLSIKKVFEKSNSSNLDFIILKKVVLSKVFQSQLKNYRQYHTFDNFFIQSTIAQYNQTKNKDNLLNSILINTQKYVQLIPVKKQFYSKFFGLKLYTIFLIPLDNDFTKKKVGYSVIVRESTYFRYFFQSILISYIGIIFLSILIGFIIFKNKKHLLEVIEKEKYKIESYTDELTKLKNRKSYNQHIHEKIQLYNRYNEVFSLIIFDIDHFKNINDTYGHKIGDEVLIDISNLVKKFLRKNDYMYRIGGEEFIIILPYTKIKQGIIVCEKIKELVEKELKTIKNKTITISLGITQIQKEDTESTLFTRVDRYLYKSKNKGRNAITSDLDI